MTATTTTPAAVTTTTAEAPAASSTTATTTSQPRRLAAIDDRAGDTLGSPGYADLVAVGLDDTGPGLRVVVDMAADVPNALADGEVEGVGIDIYRSNDDESDFQIFLDGGADGWRAHLQTPEGFVSYPGTFAIGGRRLVAEVPWESIGGREGGRVAVFCDWSAHATPLNRTGSDHAPEAGRTSFAV